jgi:disulfide bond formation protein DsbB
MNIALLLFIYSTSALALAYTSQYGFGLLPCILCLYQRYPLFAVMVLSFVALFCKNKLRTGLVVLSALLLLVGAGIALYHVGVEQGIVDNGGCDVGETVPSTLEKMTAQLMGKPNVPCDKPQFVLFGVSMAGWNFIFSGLMGVFTLVMSWRRRKNVA